MPEYTVSGKGTRVIEETVCWTVVVTATSLATVEESVRNAISSGDYDVEDTSVEDEGVMSRLVLENIELTSEEAPEVDVDDPDTYSPARVAAPQPPAYTPTGRQTGAEGVAVARVETRNGYAPARVRHVAG